MFFINCSAGHAICSARHHFRWILRVALRWRRVTHPFFPLCSSHNTHLHFLRDVLSYFHHLCPFLSASSCAPFTFTYRVTDFILSVTSGAGKIPATPSFCILPPIVLFIHQYHPICSLVFSPPSQQCFPCCAWAACASHAAPSQIWPTVVRARRRQY
jgi:hypothetical protein